MASTALQDPAVQSDPQLSWFFTFSLKSHVLSQYWCASDQSKSRLVRVASLFQHPDPLNCISKDQLCHERPCVQKHKHEYVLFWGSFVASCSRSCPKANALMPTFYGGAGCRTSGMWRTQLVPVRDLLHVK